VDLPNLQPLIGIVLLVAGGGILAFQNAGKLWKRFRPKTSQPGDSGYNTDAAAPAGFCDHLTIIVNAAPNAPADTILCYCEDGKTEAQVLVAERDRLQALVKGSAE
jgi:hypothetical protein